MAVLRLGACTCDISSYLGSLFILKYRFSIYRFSLTRVLEEGRLLTMQEVLCVISMADVCHSHSNDAMDGIEPRSDALERELRDEAFYTQVHQQRPMLSDLGFKFGVTGSSQL